MRPDATHTGGPYPRQLDESFTGRFQINCKKISRDSIADYPIDLFSRHVLQAAVIAAKAIAKRDGELIVN